MRGNDSGDEEGMYSHGTKRIVPFAPSFSKGVMIRSKSMQNSLKKGLRFPGGIKTRKNFGRD